VLEWVAKARTYDLQFPPSATEAGEMDLFSWRQSRCGQMLTLI
jgi:hypothetical protein